jgi:hypothetical protein
VPVDTVCRGIVVDRPQTHWSERALDPASPPARALPPAVHRSPRVRGHSRTRAIIWALVAVLVVAAGATALLLLHAKNVEAAERKAKAAALEQMGIYTDYAQGISFQVPTRWEQISLEEAIAALDNAGGMGALPSTMVAFGEGSPVSGGSGPGAMMMFAAQDYPSSSHMDVKEVLELSRDALKKSAPPGLSFEGGVKYIEGAALAGAEMTLKVTSAGQTVLMRFCFLDSGSCCYMFLFMADDRTWEKSRYFFDGTVETFSLVDL